MRAGRLAVGAFVALLIGVAVAMGAVTADAGRCDLWNGQTVVNDGDCYYTNDTVGPFYVTAMTGGTVNGGNGSDLLAGTMTGGTFNGGDGDDLVVTLSGGTFNGGGDNDDVFWLGGGTFNGGGDDDTVGNLMGGTFNGGPHADNVIAMCSGTFAGGGGDDVVEHRGAAGTAGTVWSASTDEVWPYC